jgi:hypothetical protein
LIKDPPRGAPVPPILPQQQGVLALDKTKFAASFAADVVPERAEFMANGARRLRYPPTGAFERRKSARGRMRLPLPCNTSPGEFRELAKDSQSDS